jgi:regulator of nucleoside diphosphate kinase
MRDRDIVINESDAAKLRVLLAAQTNSERNQGHLEALRDELERALVLEPDEVPRDVVTMNTRVRVVDVKSGDQRELTLVFPADADVSARRISVLAPLGTAILGYREGDEIEWAMPGGVRRLRVEEVFQPSEIGNANRREAMLQRSSIWKTSAREALPAAAVG